MKQKFTVSGMTCSACQAHVQKSVAALPGIQSVQVNLLTHSMVVEYRESLLSEKQILQAVSHAGYSAEPVSGDADLSAFTEKETAQMVRMKRNLISSVIFLILLMLDAWHLMGQNPFPTLHASERTW